MKMDVLSDPYPIASLNQFDRFIYRGLKDPLPAMGLDDLTQEEEL